MSDEITGTVLFPSPEWRTHQRGMRCRMPKCGRPARFDLWRDSGHWWAYCEEHTYGHVWLRRDPEPGHGMYYPIALNEWGIVA